MDEDATEVVVLTLYLLNPLWNKVIFHAPQICQKQLQNWLFSTLFKQHLKKKICLEPDLVIFVAKLM